MKLTTNLHPKRVRPAARRALFLLTGTVIFLCVFTALRPAALLRPIGRLFVVNDTPHPADGVVVLLGGGVDRVRRAVELYREGYAPRIIIGSGPRSESQGSCTEGAEPYCAALRDWQVPVAAVTVASTKGASDTARELGQIARQARQWGIGRVLLVSSPSHTRRVSIIWNRVAKDIEATVIPSDEESLDFWWTSSRARYEILYETAALVKEGYAQLKSQLGVVLR